MEPSDFLDSLRRRPRRMRRTANLRRLARESRICIDHLVQPVFVSETAREPQAIESMPGIHRWDEEGILAEAKRIAEAGLPALALFPSIDPARKDPSGSEAENPQSLVFRVLRRLKAEFPDLVLIADIALDPYTTHGHDGVLDTTGVHVDNDATVQRLCRMAVLAGDAGADLVAPSDMMDGRIGAIREALDHHGLHACGILSYSAKYASAYYGPFREAVGSAKAAGTPALDKRTYQLDPANRREAMTELRLDEDEGADMLMVKPAGPYLDIIREARALTRLPIAAYQVSGEYAQLHAAARLGWLDLEACARESLLAIHRAGADVILTYFARWFAENPVE